MFSGTGLKKAFFKRNNNKDKGKNTHTEDVQNTTIVQSDIYVMNKEYNLPNELLHKIIQDTDHNTFMNCRKVCNQWKSVVDYIAQNTNIYERFCKDDFNQLWEKMMDQSMMRHREVYFNLKVWPKIYTALETKGLLFEIDNEIDAILSINPSKEGKLYISTIHDTLIFDIDTKRKVKSMLKLKKTPINYNYLETEFASIFHSSKELYIQKHPKSPYYDTGPIKCMIENVFFFKIMGTYCVFYSGRSEVGRCNLKTLSVETLARWYSSDKIRLLQCDKDNIYMLTYSGSILTYKDHRLYKIDQMNLYTEDTFGTMVDLSVGTYKMYLRKSIVILYFDYHHVYIKTDEGTKIYKSLFSINSALYHANMLIFGTYCGEVYIYSIPKESDLLNLDLSCPIVYHSLSMSHSMKPILGFRVYERYGIQFIFFWTESSIFYLKYDHFNKEKVRNLTDDAPGGNLSRSSIFKRFHYDH